MSKTKIEATIGTRDDGAPDVVFSSAGRALARSTFRKPSWLADRQATLYALIVAHDRAIDAEDDDLARWLAEEREEYSPRFSFTVPDTVEIVISFGELVRDGDRCNRCRHPYRWADVHDDARGIYLGRWCDECAEIRLGQYRPEVLTDSGYYADEPIEPEA